MSSIRAIITVGTVVLAIIVLQSQAAGQGNPSSMDPTVTAGGNTTFFGYAGFIGDEAPDASAPDAAFLEEPPQGGFISYVQDETPSVPMPETPDTFETASEDCVSCYGPFLRDPWVSIEYMHAWARGRWLPPLVTTHPPGGGVFPGAPVLFGNQYVGSGLQASGRLSFGAWLNEDESLGVGGRFFALEGDTTGFAAASIPEGSPGEGGPMIARPFFNTDAIFPPPGIPDALIVTDTGLRTGDLVATARNEVLGADAYIRYEVLRCTNRRVDFLAGYHFTRIDDSLNVNHRMTQIGGIIPDHTGFEFDDLFDVHNEFHGAELGLLSEFDGGPFTLSMMGKLSMGNMRETLTISGWSSRTTPPPASVTTPFPRHGLLAMPTNVGTYTRDDFAIIPEAEFKVICRITERLEASIGYSFVYWSDVALAGQQVDMSMGGQPTVNASQLLGGGLVGPANPRFVGIRDSDFWIQALSIGLTFKH